MTHLGTRRIETPRLILRPFAMEDAEPMYRNWASDPEVTKFLTWKSHESVEDADSILNSWIPQYEDNTFYQWAIEPKELGQPIGSIAVVSQNEKAQTVHIGYCIGRPWWGQGIMTEALGAVIDFFFTQVGAGRVEALHDPRNVGSGAVMRKCGMKYEGTHRRSIWSNQGITDGDWYAILKEDWVK